MFWFNKNNSLIKKQDEIEKIRASAHIVHLVHQELKKVIKPGVSLLELDKLAHDLIIENGGRPAFLGYKDFPGTICASVNEVLVHGVPTEYRLKDGDIISVDVGVEKNGYYGDAAFSIGVGNIASNAKKILETCKLCLDEVVKIIKPGTTVGDIGNLVETIANANNFKVPLQYVGHGIGKKLHEDPMIPNYGRKGDGEVLKEGMVICVEPMLVEGTQDLFTDPVDNWTVRSKNRGLCAHEEHTILVTKEGAEVLNK